MQSQQEREQKSVQKKQKSVQPAVRNIMPSHYKVSLWATTSNHTLSPKVPIDNNLKYIESTRHLTHKTASLQSRKPTQTLLPKASVKTRARRSLRRDSAPRLSRSRATSPARRKPGSQAARRRRRPGGQAQDPGEEKPYFAPPRAAP